MDKNWIGCAPDNFRSGRPLAMRPEAIVIHIIVGPLHSADVHFNDPRSKVSAHYGVGKNGVIHQYVQETDTAFHAGIVVNPTWPLIKPRVNPNFYTIGIEHEGLPDDPWPEAQYAASSALVGEVAARWKIPLDLDHVIKHHAIRASKTCPGSQVSLEELVRRAKETVSAPLTPFRRTVQAVVNLNLRLGGPSRAAPVVQLVRAGTAVDVAAFTDSGERVSGNSFWYATPGGHFIWAGGTDVPHPEATQAAGV